MSTETIQNPDTVTRTSRSGGGAGRDDRDLDQASTKNAWLLVAKRELIVRALNKGFIIGTLITLAMIAAGIGYLAFTENRTASYAVVTTAADAEMGQALAAAAPGVDERVTINASTAADETAAREAVRSGAADGWLHQEGTGWTLTTESSESSLLSLTQQVVRDTLIDQQARELGTTAAALEAGSVVTPSYLVGDAEREGLASAIGFAMALLFFISLMQFGMQIANSVVEEKQSRIVEIIATSIPLRHLLAGKIIANTVLAMLQLLLIAGVSLIGLSFTEYGSLIPAIGGPIGWFIAFFLAGFVALAALWAIAGSLASRTEDLQTTSAPLIYLAMGIYFASFLLSGTPKVIASFVPPVSSVMMPIRILEGDVPLWQPIVALALLVGSAFVTIMVGERLYRRSLLQSGGRVSLKQAWKAAE